MTVESTLWVEKLQDYAEILGTRKYMGRALIPGMEKTLHYLGGLLDGEGSFQISVGKEKRTPLGYRARPKVEVWMKRENGREDEIRWNLEQLAIEAGVSCQSKEVDRQSDSYECWKFGVFGHTNVVPFIQEIKPYLRLKEQHAKLLLEPQWRGANSEVERFMEIMDVRERLRSISADRGSKYDRDYFKKEFDL